MSNSKPQNAEISDANGLKKTPEIILLRHSEEVSGKIKKLSPLNTRYVGTFWAKH